MSELLRCNFTLPADFSAPLDQHAFGLARDEINRLLLFNEYPERLQIEFCKMDADEAHNKKSILRMPQGIEPSFDCARAEDETYRIDATLPFSTKMKRFIGACSLGLTVEFPNKNRSTMGRLCIDRLERIFALAESESKYPISRPQMTAAATLRDFNDSMVSFRNNIVQLKGYTYRWLRTPPLE